MADNYRVYFEIDEDYELDGCDGKPLPESPECYDANGGIMSNGEYVDYAEYLRYYGNPDRHVVLSCIVERECVCCGCWTVAESLHGIDMMDDSEGMHTLAMKPHYYTAAEAVALPDYLGEVARETLEEATS